MVKFRCKRSGNFVSFSNEDDIAGLRKHEGYEEIKEKEDGLQEEIKAPAKEMKKIGRPRKTVK